MSLFQKSVEKKYLSELNEAVIHSKYTAFQEYFGNSERQENTINSREDHFSYVWGCLSKVSILINRFLKIITYSIFWEENITNKLYTDHSIFRSF
jgi:hypothetical protein